MLNKITTTLSAFALSYIIASSPTSMAAPSVSKVIRINGKPIVHHNGKPLFFAGIQYWGLDNWSVNKWDKDIQNFKKLKLNGLRLNIAWDHIETQEGKFDFSKLDALLKKLEKENILIYLQFNQSAHNWKPKWFEEKKVKEGWEVNARNHKGKKVGRYSFSSDKWAEYYYNYVTKTIKHVKSYSNIVAYSVYTEPHFAPDFKTWLDFNPENIAKFKLWLKEKYSSDISALNTAWGTKFKTFSDARPLIKMPPKNWKDQPEKDKQRFLEWRKWNSIAKARFIGNLIKQARKVDPNHLYGQNMMWKWTDGNQAMVALDPEINYEYADLIGINIYPNPKNFHKIGKNVNFIMSLHDYKKPVWLAEFNYKQGQATTEGLNKMITSGVKHGATGFVYFTYRAIKAMGKDRGHYGAVCDTDFKTKTCSLKSFNHLQNYMEKYFKGNETLLLETPLPKHTHYFLWDQDIQYKAYLDKSFSISKYHKKYDKFGPGIRALSHKKYKNKEYDSRLPIIKAN